MSARTEPGVDGFAESFVGTFTRLDNLATRSIAINRRSSLSLGRDSITRSRPSKRAIVSSSVSIRGFESVDALRIVTKPDSKERSISSRGVYPGRPHIHSVVRSAIISGSVTEKSRARRESSIP